MKMLIKLTHQEANRPVFVNPEDVSFIDEYHLDDDQYETRITLKSGQERMVKESPSVVARKIEGICEI